MDNGEIAKLQALRADCWGALATGGRRGPPASPSGSAPRWPLSASSEPNSCLCVFPSAKTLGNQQHLGEEPRCWLEGGHWGH